MSTVRGVYMVSVIQDSQPIVSHYTDCPLQTLHGVSAMGTKLAFYSKHGNGPATPPRIVPDLQMVADIAPIERWDSDILTEEGLQRFMAVVNEIKEGCEAVQVDGTSSQLYILWCCRWLTVTR